MRTRVPALIIGGLMLASVAAVSAVAAQAAPSTKTESGTLISVCLTLQPNAPFCIQI